VVVHPNQHVVHGYQAEGSSDRSWDTDYSSACLAAGVDSVRSAVVDQEAAYKNHLVDEVAGIEDNRNSFGYDHHRSLAGHPYPSSTGRAQGEVGVWTEASLRQALPIVVQT